MKYPRTYNVIKKLPEHKKEELIGWMLEVCVDNHYLAISEDNSFIDLEGGEEIVEI